MLFACENATNPPASAPPPPVAPVVTKPTKDARCAVWDRELSFAAAVAAHDEAAFTAHLQANAMFVQGETEVTAGPAAIAADWKSLLAGAPVVLSWHPTSIVIAKDSGIAVSRGPYLVEDSRPSAASRFKRGIFQSVWVRDPDGVYRVLVDGGTPPASAISQEEAEKLRSELHAPCPYR